MASILKISDGTTTIDFLASDKVYRVSSWSPAVAKRRSGLLGGRGPYEDVTEEIEISIAGSSALSALETLQHLCDQAVRWANGEDVDAVLFHYKPTAGSQELKATILGAAGPGEEMITLPPNYVDAAVMQMIEPVTLRFKRLGMWLGTAVTSTSASVTHPTVATIGSLTDVKIDSPVLLKMNSLTTNAETASNSFVLITSAATTTAASQKIIVVDAEGWATGAFTSVADSTNKARGNNVLRYTPAGTTEVNAAAGVLSSSALTTVRRWGVFFNYRNNGSTSYKVRFRLVAVGGNAGFTPPLAIASGASTPQWVYAGAVSLNNWLLGITLYVTASAGSSSMDIDTVVLMAMDSSTDRAVATLPLTASGFTTAGDFVLDHQLLSEQTPLVYVNENNAGLTKLLLPYRGDAVLTMRGPAMAAVWLAAGETTAAYWRNTNQAGTVLSGTFTATQTEARLTPE